MFTGVQLDPLLVEINTPPPDVAANKLLPITAKELIYRFVNPVFTGAQLDPLSVERNIPLPNVATKRLLPTTTRGPTAVVVKPVVLTRVQFIPLSVERNMPPVAPVSTLSLLDAIRLLPTETTEEISPMPPLMALQFDPTSVERNNLLLFKAPAMKLLPIKFNEVINVLVKPEFTADQFAPLFVERKIPCPEVPARIVEPLTNKEIILVFPKPVFV